MEPGRVVSMREPHPQKEACTRGKTKEQSSKKNAIKSPVSRHPIDRRYALDGSVCNGWKADIPSTYTTLTNVQFTNVAIWVWGRPLVGTPRARLRRVRGRDR